MRILREGSRQKNRRAFTLTEIAIVLGIIGLILGAIWVAAAAVYTNLHISRTQQTLLQITQAVRSMYATATTADPGANMTKGTAAQSGGGLTYIQAGVFPTDLLDTGNPATALTVHTPWGINSDVYIQAATDSTANDSFLVAFDGVPLNGCIQLLTSATGQGRDPGMFKAGGAASNATPAGTALVPGTPLGAASTGCTSNAGGSAAAFYFHVRA